jgi:undecaprenyl phosphate N,N'-diacetylbacillosamine 1-phosphate transferase
MYKYLSKRIFDLLLSLIGFMVLFPVFLVLVLILIYINNGKPFFFQSRPGKNEKIFKIIKFKTMTDERDEKGDLLPDFERMTKIGNFVRKTSLDEIPQLINVIKGDMSLIGPRPLIEFYLSLYNEEQAKRHNVRPGITGWAQVNGRNAISWKEKFALDVYYVKNLSSLFDMRILFLTVKKVLIRDGVNSDSDLSMPHWYGGKDE